MGLLPTPDGNCYGVTCWVAVIPAQPADPGQYDNNHDGSGFMMGAWTSTALRGSPRRATTGSRGGTGRAWAPSTATAVPPAAS